MPPVSVGPETSWTLGKPKPTPKLPVEPAVRLTVEAPDRAADNGVASRGVNHTQSRFLLDADYSPRALKVVFVRVQRAANRPPIIQVLATNYSKPQ